MQSVRSTLAAALLLLSARQSSACFEKGGHHVDADWLRSVTAHNNEFRSLRRHLSPQHEGVTAIDNVRVFDGHRLLPESTVYIEGEIITTCPEQECNVTNRVDGNHGVLLPGLIDAHAHPANATELLALTQYGVTTTAVMACYNPQACMSLMDHPGITDVIVGSLPASAPGSTHGNITEAVDRDGSRLVYNATMAPQWLDDALAWGPAFVKLIAESPGLDQETLNVLTQRSHENNKPVACHAAAHDAWVQAATAGVDNIQHTPIDMPIPEKLARGMICRGQISTPTLAIMKAISEKNPLSNYKVAEESVGNLYRAGVPILAGTDANQIPGLIASVPFGSSLHEELQLLVQAGLSPVAALQAATFVSAKHWGLHDRGVIAPGKRADLLLVSGNPLEDITATQNIQGVWLAGIKYKGAIGTF